MKKTFVTYKLKDQEQKEYALEDFAMSVKELVCLTGVGVSLYLNPASIEYLLIEDDFDHDPELMQLTPEM